MINLLNPKSKIDFYFLFVLNSIKGIIFSLKRREYINEGIEICFPHKLVSFNHRAVFFDKQYEAEELYLVKKYIKKDDIVLELGGCLGFISCSINKILEKPKKHIVLEPNPNLLFYLNKNKLKNNCNFIIEDKVISDRKYENLYFNSTILGSSIKKESETFIKVNGIKIKDLEKKYDLEFNTLVVDIEGAEFNLINQLKFEEYCIEKIIVEFHDFANILSSEEVIILKEKLINAGYNLVEKVSHTEVYFKKLIIS